LLHYLKSHWKKITNLSLFIVALFIFFYILKLSFTYAEPIYFAMLFYAIYRPCIKFLNKKGLSYKISTSISIIFITVLILGLFTSIGTLLFFQSENVIHNSPQWISWAENSIENNLTHIKIQFHQIPDNITENVKEQLSKVTGKIGEWIYTGTSTIFSNVSLISKIFLHILEGYILSIFLAFEMPILKKFFSNNLPSEIKIFSLSVFGDAVKGLGGYIKAQLVLIMCTFILVWIGLLILGVNNALLLSFISGILDLIPLLGVASFFVPWIVYLFVIGQTVTAIKLIVLWLIVICFRQVMEPRLTGNSIGISPFIMLAGMIVSVSILGFIGIILAPVILLIIKSLWEKGYFSLWLLGKKRIQIIKKTH
jgi:sporulation integral membrane protein YtvI